MRSAVARATSDLAVPQGRLDQLDLASGTDHPGLDGQRHPSDRPQQLDREPRDEHLLLGIEAFDLACHQHGRRPTVQRLVGPWA